MAIRVSVWLRSNLWLPGPVCGNAQAGRLVGTYHRSWSLHDSNHPAFELCSPRLNVLRLLGHAIPDAAGGHPRDAPMRMLIAAVGPILQRTAA
jgi:hypothetical protein